MNPGRMDRQVTLQRFTVAQTGIGEPLKSWSTLATVPAAYKPSPGGEPVNGDKVEAELPVVFTIRYYSGLNPKDRLQYEGTIYNILAVTEVGRRHLMELRARRQE